MTIESTCFRGRRSCGQQLSIGEKVERNEADKEHESIRNLGHSHLTLLSLAPRNIFCIKLQSLLSNTVGLYKSISISLLFRQYWGLSLEHSRKAENKGYMHDESPLKSDSRLDTCILKLAIEFLLTVGSPFLIQMAVGRHCVDQ